MDPRRPRNRIIVSSQQPNQLRFVSACSPPTDETRKRPSEQWRICTQTDQTARQGGTIQGEWHICDILNFGKFILRLFKIYLNAFDAWATPGNAEKLKALFEVQQDYVEKRKKKMWEKKMSSKIHFLVLKAIHSYIIGVDKRGGVLRSCCRSGRRLNAPL